MDWLVRFAKSSVGAKAIMAATGAGMVGFVVAHMLGNFQIFLGQDAFNAYADWLKHDVGGSKVTWVLRFVMLSALVLHVVSAVRVRAMAADARKTAYQAPRVMQTATVSSRTMMFGGIVLALFIVYHLAHFTLGFVHADYYALVDPQGRHDAYSMFVLSFQHWWISALYMIANVALAFHIGHGATSVFQTLGLTHPKYQPIIAMTGPALGIFIGLGNIILPLSVLLGMVKPVGGL